MEALVTIAVLIALLPVIVEGFTIASKMALRTRLRADATALAQSTMDELISSGNWQNGNSSSQQTIGPMTYTINGNIVDWPEADNQQLSNVEQLDVVVNWTFENQPDQITLSTVIYTGTTTTTTGGSNVVGGTP